jgi:hypothetical protein
LLGRLASVLAPWLALGSQSFIAELKERDGSMNNSAHTAPTSNRKALRTRLYAGKPLTSRAKWLIMKIAYVLACLAGVAAVLTFADGVILAIGLTVMAFFVGGIFELFALRYDDYRREWELANGGEASSP